MSAFAVPPTPRRRSSWKSQFEDHWTSFDERDKHVNNISWYILTKEVANKLAKMMRGKKVFEPASGRGYLANQMRQRGVVDYHAIDLLDERWYPNGLVNYGSTAGDVFDNFHTDADIVVLTWPPYADPFGVEVLRRMVPGQVLIFQGEGWCGCTGDDDMFEFLDEQFEKIEHLTQELNRYHIKFWGIHDRWSVYVRK